MALVYCEICGVLIKGPQGQAPVPEGVICDGCFASRRAVVTTTEPATPESGAMVQFNCCYCHSLLRLKAVGKRTRIKCPKCADAFYLHPDGRIESKLEGNTTAILQAEAALRPLTPAEGLPPTLGRAEVPDGPAKTQPMRRDELNKTQPLQKVGPEPPASNQRALLDELKPKKLEFLEGVPQRAPGEAAIVDTDAFASAPLELLPDGVSPGQARAAQPEALRPSEEGKVDLDAEGLRRKTAKYQQRQLASRATTKKHRKGDAEEAPPPPPREERKTTEKRRKAADDGEKAEKADGGDDARREERDRRAAEAARKAQELQAQEAKQRLGALSLTTLALLPAVLAGLLLSMTTRGQGFAVRGAFGERMQDVGHMVDKGTRSLGGLVNPYLPEPYRLPTLNGR